MKQDTTKGATAPTAQDTCRGCGKAEPEVHPLSVEINARDLPLTMRIEYRRILCLDCLKKVVAYIDGRCEDVKGETT